MWDIVGISTYKYAWNNLKWVVAYQDLTVEYNCAENISYKIFVLTRIRLFHKHLYDILAPYRVSSYKIV